MADNQAPAAAPGPPAQVAHPAQVAPQPPAAANPIPAMANPHIQMTFGRMDSDYTIVDHVLQIANQDTLSGETYDQLQAISSIDLNITRPNFIRMWKTLILKRVQDIFEIEKNVRAGHFIRLTRTISVPAPLADLLASLGSFSSHATGHIHHITSPPQAAQPEAFWTVDAPIVNQWNILIGRMQHHFLMKEYPSQRETDNRPLMLTYRDDQANDTLQVKAFTNEPKLVDAYIRSMNDELFVVRDHFDLEHCALIMTPLFHVPSVRGAYIGSYVLNNNA